MEEVTKKDIIIANVFIWLVAATWFAIGYLSGMMGVLEDVKDWFTDKYDAFKRFIKRIEA